jgi:hypothetical protein
LVERWRIGDVTEACTDTDHHILVKMEGKTFSNSYTFIFVSPNVEREREIAAEDMSPVV